MQSENVGTMDVGMDRTTCHEGRHCVLVVEDDPGVREGLAEIIEGEGYDVVRCSDGRAALERLAKMRELPGVILLDFMMPHMDGWAFLEERRKDSRIADIPVVGMSASQGLIEKSKQPGDVTEFLPKPFKVETILRFVERHCAPAH